MKLSSKNIFALYYRWIYSALPNDICTFFWGTVTIIITCMVVVPGRLVNLKSYRPDYWDNLKSGGFVYLIYLLSILFGVQILGYEKGDPIPTITLFLWGPLAFLGVAVAVVGTIALIGYGIYTLRERQLNKRRQKRRNMYPQGIPSEAYEDPGPSKASLWIGAIRKKHCTKIEWDESAN